MCTTMVIKYDNVDSTVSKTLTLSMLKFQVFIVPAAARIQAGSLDLSDPKE
jgi:hypothetical protein